MKKILLAMMACAAIFVVKDSQALPHDNRSDVDDVVQVFIPYSQFGLQVNSGALTSATSSEAQVTYISSHDLSAIRIGSEDLEDIPLFIQLPDNVCVDCPVKIGVVWSTDSGFAAQTVTWRVRYGRTAVGSGIATATTALDTAIAQDLAGSAYSFQETPLGIINGGKLSRQDMLTLLVEMNSTSLTPETDIILFHGINLYYTREKL